MARCQTELVLPLLLAEPTVWLRANINAMPPREAGGGPILVGAK